MALPVGATVGERAPMGPQVIREYAVKMARRYRRRSGKSGAAARRVCRGHRAAPQYAITLLGGRSKRPAQRRGCPSRFGPEVAAALVALWRAMDYPWSRRLQAMLPLWLPRVAFD